MSSQKKPVGVVPVGEVPEIALKVIAAHISGYFNLSVQILPPLEHPEYALDERRFQYNAGIILKAFESIRFKDYDKVIGVLNLDLFVPIFTHVFGEQSRGGNSHWSHCSDWVTIRMDLPPHLHLFLKGRRKLLFMN